MNRCEAIVAGDTWSPHKMKCGRPAKVERDGHHFCGLHDPVKRQAKIAASAEKYKQKWEANERKRRIELAAPELLEVLKEVNECSAYWSDYDVPIGLHDRIKAAIRKAEVGNE